MYVYNIYLMFNISSYIFFTYKNKRYFFVQVDELSFEEGDLLYVYERDTDPNWWRAKCGDQKGLIPVAYGKKGYMTLVFDVVFIISIIY